MRRRTHLIALVFVGLSIWTFVGALLVTPGAIAHALNPAANPRTTDLRLLIGIWVGGLEWPFWWALLRRRPWAWRVLVVVYCGSVLERCWTLATAPAYYAAHPQLDNTVVRFALTLFWALVGTVLPLWALLTDRPGGWDSAREAGQE